MTEQDRESARLYLQGALHTRKKAAKDLTVQELLLMVDVCHYQIRVFENILGVEDRDLYVEFFKSSLAVYETELAELTKEIANV